MQKPIYREALAHAWQMVWHNKLIWLFGLLSALLGQVGLNDFIGYLGFLSDGMFVPTHVTGWELFSGWNALWSVWLLVIFGALFAGVIFVAVSSQGALITLATGRYWKKSLSLSEAWHWGTRHAWRLFFLTVYRKVLTGLVFLGTAYFLVSLPRIGFWPTALLVLFVAMGVFLAMAISSVSMYAAGYVVHDDLSLRRALPKAWRLFRNHILVSFELSLVALLVVLLGTMLIFSTGVVVLVPSAVLTLLAGLTGFTTLITVGVWASLILLIAYVMVVGAFCNAYLTTAWMYLFMKMHNEGVGSRLAHLIRRLIKIR